MWCDLFSNIMTSAYEIYKNIYCRTSIDNLITYKKDDCTNK